MSGSTMSVTFLGTSSGGGPSESRNCSSLVCDMLADQSLWMVDCAEGTTRQFALQPHYTRPHVRTQKVSKIFITHMHADHIMGIVPFLRSVLFPPPAEKPSHSASLQRPPKIELYGSAGLRLFVRQIMKMTLTRTLDNYVVHELLTAEDAATPCDPLPINSASSIAEPNMLHWNEIAGLDVRASPDGLWRAITQENGKISKIVVDAGPIHHRDPCIGYTFSEIQFPCRKLVILGDTYDPAPIFPLCINPSPTLLIHEATDSQISHYADPSGKLSRRTASEVRQKALSRGHSVPEMAGTFAKQVNAQDLVLNHIGGRFPAPRNPQDHARHKIINDIGKKASQAWGKGKHVTVAHDFLRVHVPFNDVNPNSSPPALNPHHGQVGVLEAEFEVVVEVSVESVEIEASTSGGPARSGEDSEPSGNRKRRR